MLAGNIHPVLMPLLMFSALPMILVKAMGNAILHPFIIFDFSLATRDGL